MVDLYAKNEKKRFNMAIRVAQNGTFVFDFRRGVTGAISPRPHIKNLILIF